MPVVALRWAIDDPSTTEGTADEREEAITASEDPAPVCERIPHTTVLQAGPKADCGPAKKTPVGCSSFDLGDAADGMECRGQLAREI